MPKILMRRDTAANWTSANPTLASGEWALETDTGKMKLGDGTTTYNTLSYYTKEDDEWTKPADWPDIRSGAKDNSVYFLVGHGRDIHDLEKYYTIENGVLTAADNRVYWHNTEHGGGYGETATYFKAGFVPTNKTAYEIVCKRIRTTDGTSEINSSPFHVTGGTYDVSGSMPSCPGVYTCGMTERTIIGYEEFVVTYLCGKTEGERYASSKSNNK